MHQSLSFPWPHTMPVVICIWWPHPPLSRDNIESGILRRRTIGGLTVWATLIESTPRTGTVMYIPHTPGILNFSENSAVKCNTCYGLMHVIFFSPKKIHSICQSFLWHVMPDRRPYHCNLETTSEADTKQISQIKQLYKSYLIIFNTVVDISFVDNCVTY